MTVRKRRNSLLAVVAVVLLGAAGWAWIDGGREPLHMIVEPVAVPEAPR